MRVQKMYVKKIGSSSQNKFGWRGRGAGDPNFLHISSSWVKMRLQNENHLPKFFGSALKVELVGWDG